MSLYFLSQRSYWMLSALICVTLWNLPSRRKPHLRTAVQRAVGKCCVISVWSSSLLFLNDLFCFVVFELAGLICILMIRRLMNRRTYKAGCYFLPHGGQVFGCVDSFRMLTWWFLAGFFCRISPPVCVRLLGVLQSAAFLEDSEKSVFFRFVCSLLVSELHRPTGHVWRNLSTLKQL